MAQNVSQVPEDHADVVTAAAEDSEEGVSGCSFQWASCQAAVVLHVADHRLDSAASSLQFRDSPGDAPPRTADEDFHIPDAVSPISPIHKGHLGPLVGQDFDLLQRLAQGVAIVGIARQRPHPDHKATPVGRCHTDLGAELVALVGFSFRDAVDGWFMQAVKLLAVLWLSMSVQN